MVEQIRICGNTCEGVDFELYSDNDKYHYQKLIMTRRVPHGKSITLSIAPVDFFTTASAIMCDDQLCDMINTMSDTWSAESFENALEELFKK